LEQQRRQATRGRRGHVVDQVHPGGGSILSGHHSPVQQVPIKARSPGMLKTVSFIAAALVIVIGVLAIVRSPRRNARDYGAPLPALAQGQPERREPAAPPAVPSISRAAPAEPVPPQPRPRRPQPSPRPPTATKIEPRAFRQFDIERKTPTIYFDAEKRNPIWANAMEDVLKRRFEKTGDTLDMAGFRAETIECRESTCRIAFVFNKDDVTRARERGAVDPLDLARQATGPFSFFSYEVRAGGEWASVLDGRTIVRDDGSYSKTMILLFGEPDIDPTKYHEFVASKRRTR
jgi:hypothetical protein